jgi:hypothetical protein
MLYMTTEQINNHQRFRNAISKLTGKRYRDSLCDFDLLDITECEDSKCICGKNIHYVFLAKQKNNSSQAVNFGRCCAMQFYDEFMEQYKDNELMKDEIKKFKEWKEKGDRDHNILKCRHIKCTHCGIPWSKPRCFHSGLCVPCKKEYNDLLKTKIELPRFKGKNLKDMKEEAWYMEWCVKKGTRQADIFKQFIDFKKF